MTILYLILGLIGAWLVNFLSDVLPRTRKLVASKCPGCQRELTWQFYITFTPCGECGARPSRRHWIVLALLPALAGLIYHFPAPVLGKVGGLIWLVYFSLIVVIDIEHRLILHPVSLVGALLGLGFGIRAHEVVSTLLGGIAGFGIMLLFYLLGELFIRFLSKRRGEDIQEVALGFGDVNLAGVMGLLLGWPGVVAGVVFTIIMGGVISGIFMLGQVIQRRYRAFQALPYGPFIVLSTLALLHLADIIS